jgi:hypothetical protein
VVTAKKFRKTLAELPSSVLAGSERRLVMRAASSASGTVDASVLGAPAPYSTFLTSYESISLSDLAAIVYGLYRNGHYSSAVEQTLTADLQNAQSACGNPSQRIAAMNQFVSDANGQAGSPYAQFLAFGAQPLLLQNAPASLCQ